MKHVKWPCEKRSWFQIFYVYQKRFQELHSIGIRSVSIKGYWTGQLCFVQYNINYCRRKILNNCYTWPEYLENQPQQIQKFQNDWFLSFSASLVRLSMHVAFAKASFHMGHNMWKWISNEGWFGTVFLEHQALKIYFLSFDMSSYCFFVDNLVLFVHSKTGFIFNV